MNTRADAAGNVLADLETFQIDHQLYFDDLEPQAWYDAALTGKVKGLPAFCRDLG